MEEGSVKYRSERERKCEKGEVRGGRKICGESQKGKNFLYLYETHDGLF